MNKFRKILAGALSLAMAAALAGCDEEAPAANGSSAAVNNAATSATTTAVTSIDADAQMDMTDKEMKDIDTSAFVPSGHAGTLRYLGFYDITVDQKGQEQIMIFRSEQYGGDIEYITSPCNDAYYEKLSLLIASDESPDIVTKDALLNPGNVSKNLFEPLDPYFDIESPLWKDIADIVESFAYKGVHYYFPHRTTTRFALNYNKKTIEENGLTDPYELYKNGEWTWDAWRNMLKQFCDKSEDNVGFYTTNETITSFIATTGTTMIDVQPNGVITNNLLSPEVSRAMTFLEDLCREGLTYGKQYGDWVSPQVFSLHSDTLLFTCTEPEWTYIAATENIQNPAGVENDVFGTVSDFSFVPFPRDPDADKYYTEFDTFGYLIPKGAKNISGAVEFINLNRMYDTDPDIIAQVRKDHVDPEKIIYKKGKYEGYEKWQMKWGEREYDLWREMCDPTKFAFVNEDAQGFSTQFTAEIGQLLMGVVERGESWSQTSKEFSPMADAVIAPFLS
ncbi:MAG: ABC transporter substrate-binding protein [Oscillospiraceae bacterium]